MSRDVRVAAPTDSLQAAARVMADIDAGFLLVGEAGELIGIVTDRDIAIRGVAAGRPPRTQVRAVMSGEIRYCLETDDVDHVLDHMGEIQLRRLPVVDREGKLVGIVSLSDLACSARTARVGEALSGIARPSGIVHRLFHVAAKPRRTAEAP